MCTDKEKIIEAFNYLSQDIENILEKPWLKTALCSHIETITKLPRKTINQEIHKLFNGEPYANHG